MLKVSKQLLKSTWSPLKSSVRHNPFPVTFLHYLRNLPTLQTTTLCNGLTIATEERECCNACIGIYVKAGPRCESDFENGITHFFEHVVFKGTCARTRTAIEEQMQCTGARYRCFTTRDIAAYYAECLCEDVALTVDILTDCVFNNALVADEIENQKKVVYLEMQEKDEDTNALLEDFLHATAFQGTTLANSVMGKSSNLYNFNQKTIRLYMNKFYDAERVVLVGIGGVKHEQMVALGSTYLSRLTATKCFDRQVYRYTGSDMRYRNDSMPVANVAIAVEGPCLCDEDNVVMEVAAELIGGWDRAQPGGVDHGFYIAKASSVHQLCDAYKAFNINYNDTGLWGIQFLGPSLALDDMVYLVQSAWMSLCTMATGVELERAKRALKTKMLSRNESLTKTCHEVGKWLLYQGYIAPLHERICAVDRVCSTELKEVCTRYVYDRCPVVVAIGPTCGLTDYVRIRSGMYWLRL